MTRGPVLLQAAVIRDEQYDDQGDKDQLVRTQILALVIILSFVMAIGFAIVAVFAGHNLTRRLLGFYAWPAGSTGGSVREIDHVSVILRRVSSNFARYDQLPDFRQAA